MKHLLALTLLLAGPLAGLEATLCQEKSALGRSEIWQVEGSPDFGKAFEGIDLAKGATSRAGEAPCRALFFVDDGGGQRLLVRMYEPALGGLFGITPVTGIRGDGRLIVDEQEARDVHLPELHARLQEISLPRSYACQDSDAAARAEQEFYAAAELSPRAAAELRNSPELRRELSLVEEAELIHKDMDWEVCYIDMDAGHILLALRGESSLHLSHYEIAHRNGGGYTLPYRGSCRFSYGFADIGKPAFSDNYCCFLLPLTDEELGVKTTLRLPACAIGGAFEHATGYREDMAADSSPADALLRELMLGRYGNAVLMLRGGKVDMDAPNEQGLRPSDYIPAKLRAALQAEAAEQE